MNIAALIVAVLSMLAAIGAVIYAHKQTGIADRSASAAVKAAEASEQSLRLQQQAEARTAERTDVRWARDRDRNAPSLITLRNGGTTTAHDVYARVRINGVDVHLHADAVEPGHSIHAARDARNAHVAEMRKAGFVVGASERFVVTAALSWTSSLGTPDAQQLKSDD